MFLNKYLMCSPMHFGVNYEINPWMSLENKVNRQEALTCWQKLHHYVIRSGGYVEYMSPAENYPDLVFTANAGLARGNKVVLSNFKYKERQGESLMFRSRFRVLDYEIYELPRNMNFEGAGDALFAGDKLFAGFGFRSDKIAYTRISELLDIKSIIFCELIDPRFYHLDTCFCPLNADHALFFPDAFHENSILRMKEFINLIPVTVEDALKFACNSVILDKTVLMPMGTSMAKLVVESLGFTVIEFEMDEFIKAGGACKCLTLQL